MGFPLFNVKELDAPPVGRLDAPSPDTKPEDRAKAACPADPAQPTTYLRDLVVILIVVALLAGIAVVAYYFPRWL